MIFSELYSAYYSAVAELIKIALERPVTRDDIMSAAKERAFDESFLYIGSALSDERWQVITKDGLTPIKNAPSMPATELEKRWLKAVMLDPRMKLFGVEMPELDNVEPLFTKEDFEIFDSYGDGDPYDDPMYAARFTRILRAIREERPLDIHIVNRKGNTLRVVMMPDHLEYSEKDDKFRLFGKASKYGDTVNLARIVSLSYFDGEFRGREHKRDTGRTVTFELYDRRKALERVLLHFAHLEKETERIGEGVYRVTLRYDESDETEMLIRLLSFGPMIKVTEPESFVDLVKERLKKQMECRPDKESE